MNNSFENFNNSNLVKTQNLINLLQNNQNKVQKISLGNINRIENQLVHKNQDINVLISQIDQLKLAGFDLTTEDISASDYSGKDIFIGGVVQNTEHPFFYEHSLDHIPGLYLIEAARQFTTAIVHVYYNVPMQVQFILNSFECEFNKFAEHSIPLFLMADFYEKEYNKDNLPKMKNSCYIIQLEQVIGQINFQFQIMDKTKYQRLRKRQIQQLRRNNY